MLLHRPADCPKCGVAHWPMQPCFRLDVQPDDAAENASIAHFRTAVSLSRAVAEASRRAQAAARLEDALRRLPC